MKSWVDLTSRVKLIFRADGVIVASLLLAGLWLFAHPYRGLTHDAILYSFQALSHLYPEPFRGDLFFIYGSQDDYSLFSRLYAYLIGWLGLENATRMVLAFGHLIWLYSSWRISAVLPTPQRLAFLALLVALPGTYATKVFSYGEMFATARIVAEALTLAALAATLSRRPYLAGMLLLIAATQHPLMAFGGVLLAILWGTLHRPPHRVVGGAIVLGLAAGLALASTGLLGRLASPVDPEWLSLIRERNAYVFFSAWKLQDWNLLVLNFCLLGAGWRLNRGLLGRLFLSGLMLGVMTFLASWVGDQLWHSQLLIQIQPMRAFWLVKWLALLAFASLLSFSGNERWFPLLFSTSWFAQDSVGGVIALTGLVLSIWPIRKLSFPVHAWVLPAIALLGWIMARLIEQHELLLSISHFADDFGPSIAGQTPVVLVMLFVVKDLVALFGAVTAAGLYAVWTDRNEGGSALVNRLLPLFAGAFFCLSLLISYQIGARPQPFFASYHTAGLPSNFLSLIPQDAVVYWQDSIAKTWFLLGRRSYYSRHQSAGALFSRAATMEMKHRADALAALGVHDSNWLFDAPEPASSPPSAIRSGLLALCSKEPVDFVILKTRFPDWQVEQWVDPANKTTWWLYDCYQLRRIGST